MRIISNYRPLHFNASNERCPFAENTYLCYRQTVSFQDFYESVTPRTKKDKMTFAYELPISNFKEFILRVAEILSTKENN